MTQELFTKSRKATTFFSNDDRLVDGLLLASVDMRCVPKKYRYDFIRFKYYPVRFTYFQMDGVNENRPYIFCVHIKGESGTEHRFNMPLRGFVHYESKDDDFIRQLF